MRKRAEKALCWSWNVKWNYRDVIKFYNCLLQHIRVFLFLHFFHFFHSRHQFAHDSFTIKRNETKLTRRSPKGISAGGFELFLHSLSSQALCVCRWATSHVAHLQQHFSTVEESGKFRAEAVRWWWGGKEKVLIKMANNWEWVREKLSSYLRFAVSVTDWKIPHTWLIDIEDDRWQIYREEGWSVEKQLDLRILRAWYPPSLSVEYPSWNCARAFLLSWVPIFLKQQLQEELYNQHPENRKNTNFGHEQLFGWQWDKNKWNGMSNLCKKHLFFCW